MGFVTRLPIWLGGRVSLRPHGEVVFTDFPSGVKTITMENDIVSISTTDFTYHRDVPFEANLRVTCKDTDYGEFLGMPWKGHFYFQYENDRQARRITAPINDVHGIHPTTIAQAQQAGTGQPATRPVAKPEGSDKPQPDAEGRCP